MADLYDKIVSQRGGLERIMAKVPGFRGYSEMHARREADRLMREHIVKLLKNEMARLVDVEKRMMRGGGLSFMSLSREAKTKFQIYLDRINTEVPGYSGFYDSLKLGPEEMEKIYSFDAALIDYAELFRDTISALEASVKANEGVEEAIENLLSLAAEANEAYDMRDNLLTQL